MYEYSAQIVRVVDGDTVDVLVEPRGSTSTGKPASGCTASTAPEVSPKKHQGVPAHG